MLGKHLFPDSIAKQGYKIFCENILDRMDFIFRVYTDPEEINSHFTARKVAGIMEKNGHNIEIREVPFDMTYIGFLLSNSDKKLNSERIRTWYEDFEKKIFSPTTGNVHFIDWHSSGYGYFLSDINLATPEKKPLGFFMVDYPLDFHMHMGMSPICIATSSYPTIFGVIEIPGVKEIDKWGVVIKKLIERTGFEDIIEEVEDLELIDMYNKIRKFGIYDPFSSAKAGLMGSGVFEYIAAELEEIGRGKRVPISLSDDDIDVSRLLIDARRFPLLGYPDKSLERHEAAIKEFSTFQDGYEKEVRFLQQSENSEQELAELNRRFVLLQREVGFSADSYYKSQKFDQQCKMLGLDKRELLEFYREPIIDTSGGYKPYPFTKEDVVYITASMKKITEPLMSIQ